MHLAAHLLNQQWTVYQDDQEAGTPLRKTFTSLFELNKRYLTSYNMSSSDITQYHITYILPVITILHTKRYYLRMLLLCKSEAVRFEDILTVNA